MNVTESHCNVVSSCFSNPSENYSNFRYTFYQSVLLTCWRFTVPSPSRIHNAMYHWTNRISINLMLPACLQSGGSKTLDPLRIKTPLPYFYQEEKIYGKLIYVPRDMFYPELFCFSDLLVVLYGPTWLRSDNSWYAPLLISVSHIIAIFSHDILEHVTMSIEHPKKVWFQINSKQVLCLQSK